jgi:TetR/AcrR family transcriptional regulator
VKWAGTEVSAEEQKDRKRKLIIRHAASIFNRRGSQGATLEDVAAQLQISKAALYRYVNNKNDLLLACHQEAVRIAMRAADSAERVGENGWIKIRLTLQRHLEDMIETLGVPAMLLEENSLDTESMALVLRLRDKYESRLRQFYSDGVADGSIVRGDARIAVFMLLGALNWTAKWYSPDGRWKPDEIAEAIVEIATRGIAAKPRDTLLSTLHQVAESRSLPL